MRQSELKLDLLKQIETLSPGQLADVYGLFQNYVNGRESADEWDTFSPELKAKISAGIKQADVNQVKPVSEVTGRLRGKYGLNG